MDDELDKNTVVTFNKTLKNYLKVNVGNDISNLTKYNKVQLTDTTIIKTGNSGGYLLPPWRIFCNDKNNKGKTTNFVRATKTNSPTGDLGATSLLHIGNFFMYIETYGGNHGNNIFVNFERTDNIQITDMIFYYRRFSLLTNDSLKLMGRVRIQLLLEDNTWSTRYKIPKNDRYSDTSTGWTLLSLNFTIQNFGIKLIYDEIDTPHADMCFSNITVTHFVF